MLKVGDIFAVYDRPCARNDAVQHLWRGGDYPVYGVITRVGEHKVASYLVRPDGRTLAGHWWLYNKEIQIIEEA